ncbi:MAG: hypothetical protein EA369_08170 [Bradymonadales bacterium]|nr:MAG: hypothetical protein EA369_08170 [Bradymonadales bacterium]
MQKSFQYGILGAGMQGLAAAYYLAKHGQASRILLMDREGEKLQKAKERLNRLLGREIFETQILDAKDRRALATALKDLDAVMSAIDYSLNLEITKVAIESQTSMNDLGGNTAVVLQQLKLHEAAGAAGVSVVPDCGLAPGLANTLASYGIEQLSEVDSVKLRCGGLPQTPRPPLDYKLVFSIRGLTNEYFGQAQLIRDGKRQEIETFQELEKLEFQAPVGFCEAFVTSGGSSTCPWTFEGRVKNFDYKTVRYPGHFEKMKVLKDLGFLSEESIPLESGASVVPREVFHSLASSALDFPKDRDLVVLRADIAGKNEGRSLKFRYELIDFHDEKTEFSAMERTTGFPAAQVLIEQAFGRVKPGVRALETALDNRGYLDALSRELKIQGLT